MAQAEVIGERDAGNCWVFDVQVLHADGALTRHALELAWVDYNHWSPGGGDEPREVALAVVHFLLDRLQGESLSPRFNAALARRLHADADAIIPRYLRDSA